MNCMSFNKLCYCFFLFLGLAGKLGCNLDRHEDIGKGHIGISAFRDIVNEPRLDNIPLILETPGRWDNCSDDNKHVTL